MFLKELKLLKLAVPFILGILFATQLNQPISKVPLLILIIFLCFTFCIIPFKYPISYKWIPNCILFLGILIFSFLSAHAKIDELNPLHYSNKNSDKHIVEIISISEKKNSIQCIARVKAIFNENTLHKTIGKAIIYFNKNDDVKDLKVSDLILIYASFSEVAKPRNPYQFNYREYLRIQGINRTVFLNKNSWLRLNKIPIKSFKNKITSAKNHLQKKLKNIILNNDAYAVASALVLGDRDHLSKEVKENFQHTGGMHVLAVSGLHVGLIGFLLILLSRFNKPKPHLLKMIQALIIISGIWIYSLITGLPDSAFRAAIMLSLYILSKAFNKKTNSINILIAALIISLYVDPFCLYKVGFQFSYLALISILIFYKPIANLIITKYTWLNKFWQLNALSISAQILIAPLSIYYFSLFPVYFLLTNIFAINFASIILYSHCFYFIIQYLESIFLSSFYFSKILAFYINLELDAFIKVLSFIKNIPGSSSNIIFSHFEMLILYGIVFFLSLMFLRKRLIFGLLGICLSIFFALNRFQVQKNKSDKIFTQIYYLKKSQVIDFKIDDTIYSLHSAPIDSAEKSFNILPIRHFYGTEKTIEIPFNKSFQNKNIYKKDYLLHFQNKNFLFYDHQVPLENIVDTFIIDHALLKEFESSDLSKIQTLFKPKEYIFLYNKNYDLLRDAKAFCALTKCICHFVNSDFSKTINYDTNSPKPQKALQL